MTLVRFVLHLALTHSRILSIIDNREITSLLAAKHKFRAYHLQTNHVELTQSQSLGEDWLLGV